MNVRHNSNGTKKIFEGDMDLIFSESNIRLRANKIIADLKSGWSLITLSNGAKIEQLSKDFSVKFREVA